MKVANARFLFTRANDQGKRWRAFAPTVRPHGQMPNLECMAFQQQFMQRSFLVKSGIMRMPRCSTRENDPSRDR